jgi:hypothetical protein
MRMSGGDVAGRAAAVARLQAAAQFAGEEIRRGVAVADVQDGEAALAGGRLLLPSSVGVTSPSSSSGSVAAVAAPYCSLGSAASAGRPASGAGRGPGRASASPRTPAATGA